MSLVKSPRMTPKKVAQIRRMQKLSKGPATPAGRERVRDARLKHGFYSKSEEVALRALGEDPADFLAVLEGLRGKMGAAGAAEHALSASLARALWRIFRADRIREGNTLRQAREADDGREVRLHARTMRFRMTADSLLLLVQKVARPYYVATPEDLKSVQSLCDEGALKEMGEMVRALFYELREPGTPGFGEPGAGEDPQEQQRQVLQRIKEIFGLANDPEPRVAAPTPAGEAAIAGQPDSSPADAPAVLAEEDTAPAEVPHPPKARYPGIADWLWEAREPMRQLLENLLRREADIFQARIDALVKEIIAGPSLYERAAEITPTPDHSTLMQRMEDSNARHALRLVELLERIKRLEPGEQ